MHQILSEIYDISFGDHGYQSAGKNGLLLLARELREQRANVTLMFTAGAITQWANFGLEIGADDYIANRLTHAN